MSVHYTYAEIDLSISQRLDHKDLNNAYIGVRQF